MDNNLSGVVKFLYIHKDIDVLYNASDRRGIQRALFSGFMKEIVEGYLCGIF